MTEHAAAGSDVERQDEAELSRVDRALRLSIRVNRAVIHADDEAALLREVCRVLVDVGGYRLALIAFAEHDPGRTMRIVAHAGFEDGYIDLLRANWDPSSDRGNGPGGVSFRTGRPFISRDIESDPAMAPWRENALRRGYRSVATLPLADGDRPLGVLATYAPEANAFDTAEVEILGELCANLVFGVGALRHREAEASIERERDAHLRFAQSLDRLNRVLHGTTSLDEVMHDALEVVLEIFDADRCFLMYPCDPDAPSWSVPMERARPDGPGPLGPREELPMTAEMAATLRAVLARDAPVSFGPGCDEPLAPDVAARFGARSLIGVAVRPRTGAPWQLALHQCDRARAWTEHEVRLFHELGRRIADGLTTLLAIEELRASEARRSEAESLARLGYFESDRRSGLIHASREVCRVAGFDEGAPPQKVATWVDRVSPTDRPRVAAALEEALADGRAFSFDCRLQRPDGSEREVHVQAEIVRDPRGDVTRVTGTVQDVTEERQAARERASHLHLLESMDRINRAIQGASDLEAMMGAALDVVLDLLACDRASLVLPCDPDAPTWRVPMERTRPEYPGVQALGVEMEMTPRIAAMHRKSLAAETPFIFGPDTDLPLPDELVALGEKSGIGMALRPKLGPPWGFAVQQCSHVREWTADEVRLFQELGRRIADGLTGLIARRELRENEAYLRTLVQTIPDLVWVKDPDGAYLSCNARVERLFGVPQREIIGKSDHDFVDREIADAFRADDLAVMASDTPRSIEEWLEFAEDGYRGLFETVKTPLRGPDGRLVGVLGIARDITEHYRAEQDLRVAATAFEAQEAIVITDASQVILRVNQAFTEITGYTAEEVVGKTPRILASGRHDVAFYRAMWQALARDGYWQGELWNRRKTGELYAEWLTISAVAGASGEITHYVGTAVDITARKEAEREIEHLAFYDPLTDLPNRRLLVDRLQHALTTCQRRACAGALLFIDLDDFKVLNDTIGHDVGDRLLVDVARRLANSVRAGDTVARFGGDEFVVILENLRGSPADAAAGAAKLVAEKIRTILTQPYTIGGRTIHSSPSIGVALFDLRGGAVDELLKRADIAMYQAKTAGRNAVRFYDPATEAALATQATLHAELRVAIDRGELVLHYQPQVDHDRRLVGAEALIRWHHPTQGLMPPGTFIGLAETTGLILPIGEWVLQTACGQLRAWAEVPSLSHVRIAINVSARQFRQPDFVAQVRRALETSGARSDRLEIELTESLVLDDVEDTIAKMDALRALGVGFSMDDFGTGYSSLAYVSRLPLDQLKIDRSFVRNLPDHPNDAAVVQSVISLAGSLGLEVVAEGVEAEPQRAFLEGLGCTLWQGYLFGRPAPVARFEEDWRR